MSKILVNLNFNTISYQFKKPSELAKNKIIHFKKSIQNVIKKNKIRIFRFSIFLIFFFVYFIINKLHNNVFPHDKTEHQKINKKFFDNLEKKINEEIKYKGAKYCYYNDDDSCLYKYFCPKIVADKKLKLFGFLKDGAYVLTDDLNKVSIAYSFGVDEEYSFELDLADNGIDIYMYDPTVQGLNFTIYKKYFNKDFKHDIDYYQKKLHFFKIGIIKNGNSSFHIQWSRN